MTCAYCIDPNGDPCYPSYGPAPHECFFRIPGATIGQSRILPREEWPDNFVQDPDVPECGTWYCPHCRDGMPQHIARSARVQEVSA